MSQMAEHQNRDPQTNIAAFRTHEAELLGKTAGHGGSAKTKPTELHVCGSCGSQLVFPTDWEPAGSRHWSVHLRCPDCEWQSEGVYTQDIVDRFDQVLDEGTEAILDDLMRLTHANMEEEIDRFAAALEADQILPEDF